MKGLILLLIVLTFFGRINPARISEKTDKNISLLQSAFYFRTSTEEITALDSNASTDDEENPFAAFEMGDDADLEDFYANLAAMMEEETSDDGESEIEDSDYEDYDYEDDSALEFEKAEKITLQKYDEIWKPFKENHSEIASVLVFNRISAILTCLAILICLFGLYLSCGTNIIKKIGYITVCAGSILTAFSLINFTKAYDRLSAIFDSIDIAPSAPAGISLFLTVTILIFIVSLFLLITDKTKSEVTELSEKPFQITFRILSLLLFILLFIPGANPARISESISRNVSLFTSGFAYSTYTKNIERALIRGWVPASVIKLAFFSSTIACIGIIACGAGSCMSIGNNKLKRYGHISLLSGCCLVFVSMFGITRAYNLLASSPNASRLQPVQPSDSILFFVLSLTILGCALFSFIRTPAPEKDEKCHIDAPFQLFLMLLPFLILVLIFSYLPLWGWRYAFFDYKAGDILSLDNWVGFKWFKMPFENAATRSDIIRVLKNTLAMSGLGILTSWCPMFFAIFLVEIKNTGARRVIQTLTTIPNFISWVLVYAIAFCIFGTEGFISSMMIKWGFWEQGKNMLMGDSFIWLKMLLWGMWKGLGWSAIMYIAAISGIDQELYEAATVDGAGRFQKMIHITLPELIPTYIVLLILSVSNILSNGMDQYLVFKNSTNKAPIEVLDLYVYQLTFGAGTSGNIPFSTVVSMFKSLVSVILLFATNRISKWVRGSSIF